MTVGVIGCGNISPAYLGNINKYFSPLLDLRACADMDLEFAKKRATEFGVPKACTVGDLLADPGIELVLNLTPFTAHYEVSMAILNAGKHLFTEKSLAVTREQGREIVDTANKKGLCVAGASDTFLCGGIQECIAAVDKGEIGTPSFASALISMPGRRERYLNVFGGAMFDMGPYYLTALVALLGPVVRVTGSAQMLVTEIPYPEQSPNAGKTFNVSRPTTISGVMDFASGSVGTMTATVDGCAYYPHVEVHGTQATLVMGDANGYAAGSMLRLKDGSTRELPTGRGFREAGRGLGVAEMAKAIRSGQKPRASGDLMYHVLDIMHAFHDASKEGKHLSIGSTCDRPAPFDYDELMR
jgi:predicted dehydrogenase